MQISEVKKTQEEVAIEALSTFEKSIDTSVPVGYVRIELSTRGQLGAPKVFHIRSFDTREVAELSVTAENELPLKLAAIIDKMILEDDCSIKDFHEKEVVELLVKLFTIFYESKIELPFPITDEDILYLKENNPSLVEDVTAGRYKPTVLIDLAKINTFDYSEKNIKQNVIITSKKTGFSLKFSYPKFGDAIAVKKYLSTSYKKEDKSIQNIVKKIEYRNRVQQMIDTGKLQTDQLPYISPEEMDLYVQHEIEKAFFTIDLIRALHLVGFEGEDVSDKSIVDKIKLIQDPRVDHKITQAVEKEFEKMDFGIDPDIEVISPLDNKPCIRRFQFRSMDILQALKTFESDEFITEYD